jgi:soluble lytic murein transglycosylase
LPELSGEAGAQRLSILAEIARAEGDEDRFLKLVDQLRHAGPGSAWLEDALLSGGNMFLLKRDYDRAIDFYRELRQRFPNGKRAAYAHWKASWLTLRQGRTEEAKREFEQQVTNYPASAEVSAALYWRARFAEEDHETAKARAYYTKLSQRFRNYYYAELARERLREMGPGEAAAEPLLDRIPPGSVPASTAVAVPPEGDLRFQKAKLLANGGMFDFAVRELQAAGAPWASAQIAQMYQEGGQYHRGLQVLKRAVPSYYALALPELPRNYWEALFPRPYWSDLKKYSAKNQLDPFLVASLIRQESEFNPGAVSHADALGLMQLLPSTGKKVARELRIRRFSSTQLLVADVNLQLGTRYFRSLVDHFDGRLEYALAAYNAGADRVQSWLADGKYRDTQEFVESIPFTETREYVQAIVRNAAMYRRIYPSP